MNVLHVITNLSQGYGGPVKACKEMCASLALAGEDLSNLPVYPDDVPPSPGADALVGELLDRYSTQEAEIETWLSEQR